MKSQRYYRLVETAPPDLADQRKRIADDIKAYLAAGKKIEDVPKGKSAWKADVTLRPKQRPSGEK